MKSQSPRVAARAILLHEDRLLLVNAYRRARLGLWCAPGGGAERGRSLPENLAREMMEETGLEVSVGAPCLINEFHDPKSGFHQVDLYFHCTIVSGEISDDWVDPEGVVSQRRFFSRSEMASISYKPDALPDAAWGKGGILYDPLEPIVV